MKAIQVEFIGSATSVAACPKPLLPEVAFAGRSNVGKSSLINRLVRRKAMAKVSSTPGKTRTLNFFRVNGRFHLVDLPGYGYARRSKEERGQWPIFIESYLRSRKNLACVVLLMDASIPPVRSDEEMEAWLLHHRIRLIRVFTKSDKARQADIARRMKTLKSGDDSLSLFVSSRTGRGMDELWKAIQAILATADTPTSPAG